jgi:hypothetical protein
VIVIENVEIFPIIEDGQTLIPKSIFVFVDIPDTTEAKQIVADTIFGAKGAGCAYNGDITVTVVDPTQGNSVLVKFQRPTVLSVLVKVYIKQPTSVADPATAVRAAIIEYANGFIDGEEGLVIGQNVSPFELSGAVNIQYPSIFVQKVETTLAAAPVFNTDEINIDSSQKAQIASGSIQVIIS